VSGWIPAACAAIVVSAACNREMKRHEITRDWSIELDDAFQRRLEPNGDLVFAAPGKTVRGAVFDTHGESAVAAIEKLAGGRFQNAESFEHREGGTVARAFLILEADGPRSYHTLHAFTAVRGSVATLALSFDDPGQRPWALAAWKSLRSAEARSR
jgi:hypothetical protein